MGAQTVPKPFCIDLRNLSPEEVVQRLEEAGFSEVYAYDTDVYTWESVLCSEPFDDRVVCVHVKDEEAPHLTVTLYDGTQHTLEPGHELYWYETDPGGWGWARTSYFYK